MNNHPIEDRLRDALAAHAESVPASPDAWQHIQAKDARLSWQQHGRPGLFGAAAWHSVRGRAVLSAVTAAVAAAVTAVTLNIGSAPPAVAAVTAALTRTLTQSYHLTEQDSSYYPKNGRITFPYHQTCTSQADPVRHLEADSCSGGTRYREVGGYAYLYGTEGVGGRHWTRMPTGRIVQLPSINGFTAATPQQMLAEIKKASKVTVAGPASGPGWTGTRYAFSASPGPGMKLSGTVDVDQQGRARALVLTIRLTSLNTFVLTQVLTFSDFGAPVTVTPPPADQIIPGL
jgi:hypothetical protein